MEWNTIIEFYPILAERVLMTNVCAGSSHGGALGKLGNVFQDLVLSADLKLGSS